MRKFFWCYYRWFITSLALENVRKNAICFKLFWYKIFVHWKSKLLNVLVDSVSIIHLTLNNWSISKQNVLLVPCYLTFYKWWGREYMRSKSVSDDTFFHAERSLCLSSSSVFGAWSLYVVLSKIIQMVSRGFTSREFAGRSSFVMKFPNPSGTMSSPFSFQGFPTFNGHTSSYRCAWNFETVKLNFFTFLSCRIITHTLTAFSITFLTHLNKKKNGHPLLDLSSKVFTFDHLFAYIVQTC